RRIGRGDLRDLSQYRPQWRGRAHDLFKHRGAIDLFAQREILAPRTLFGPFAIVDVGSRRVPAQREPLFVADRVVLHEEPAVLSIVAPRALLELEGDAACEGVAPLLLQARDVVGMEDARAEARGGDFSDREAGVLE